MTVNLPLTVVLALLVWLLVRRSGLKPAHAVACVLFGFYLARSSAAPAIDDTATVLLDALSRIRF
ncbi:hypothetical protein ABZ820_39810 [Streptomyces diacarni]|uniref:hypothetical protein n=1 Tax=Streptomyces diacarni TaxID=2800381 RepID=UPI0034082439